MPRNPSNLVLRRRLAAARPTIVGVGGLGREVASQFARLGVGWLQLIDPANVTSRDARTEGFAADDVGQFKVHAAGHHCHRVNPAMELHLEPQRYGPALLHGNAVFCCCGRSLRSHRAMWSTICSDVEFFAGAWVSAESVRVFAAHDAPSRSFCGRHLRPSRRPRTAVLPTSSALAAALLVVQYARFLRGRPVASELSLHLDTLRLRVSREAS